MWAWIIFLVDLLNIDHCQQTDCIFLDFVKGLDKVNHSSLPKKMVLYGINMNALRCVQQLLLNHSLKAVKIKSSYKKTFSIEYYRKTFNRGNFIRTNVNIKVTNKTLHSNSCYIIHKIKIETRDCAQYFPGPPTSHIFVIKANATWNFPNKSFNSCDTIEKSKL